MEAFVGRKTTVMLFETSLEYSHCDYVTFASTMIRCDGLHRAVDCSSYITVSGDEITVDADGLS